MDFKKNISKRVLIFLTALVASAAGPSAVAAEKTRCAFLWGNVDAGSGDVPFVIDGVDWFYPATARDQNEPGPPGYCPSIQTTRHQAGPFVIKGEDSNKPWDFVTDFYEVTSSGGPRQKDGSCHTGRRGFNIDADGNGEGNGIACGTYVNLPTVSIEPLQVKVDKRGYLRVKMMRKGAPFRGSVRSPCRRSRAAANWIRPAREVSPRMRKERPVASTSHRPNRLSRR